MSLSAACRPLSAVPTLNAIRERPELAASLTPDAALQLLAQASADLAATQTARDALLVRVATADGSPAVCNRPDLERLVDAKEMARRLDVHESWVRTEQRARRLPFVKIGRYIRFRPSEVIAALKK